MQPIRSCLDGRVTRNVRDATGSQTTWVAESQLGSCSSCSRDFSIYNELLLLSNNTHSILRIENSQDYWADYIILNPPSRLELQTTASTMRLLEILIVALYQLTAVMTAPVAERKWTLWFSLRPLNLYKANNVEAAPLVEGTLPVAVVG